MFSCLLTVSNSEPATRSEISLEYSSPYSTAPLNSLGKTYNGKKLCLNVVKSKSQNIKNLFVYFFVAKGLTLLSSLLISSSEASGDRRQ